MSSSYSSYGSQASSSGSSGGVFGPAVRLMRTVPFSAKAWLISAAFSVPLALLLFSFWSTKHEQIATTQLEIDGVNYAKVALDVSRKARLVRVAALADAAKPSGKLAQAKADLAASIKQMEVTQAQFGAVMGTDEAVKKAKQLSAEVPDSYETLFKGFAATTKLVKAWHEVLDVAIDGSGLALDPDADSYYALQVGLVSIPKMYESLGRVINLSAATSAMGQGAQVAAAEVSRSDALVEDQLHQMAEASRKVVAANPSLLSRFNAEPIVKQISALRDLATDDVGSGGEAQAAKILAMGNEVRKSVSDYQNGVMAALEELLTARLTSLKRSLVMTMAVTALGVLIAIYLFVGFARSMFGALKAVTKKVDLIASGDLSTRFAVQGRDELATILHRTTDMSDSLVLTIGQVTASADQVASVSEQLQRGTSDLAERTENTASQLQKTASSMEEMHATVANTASATQQAASLATSNASLAAEGGKVISDVVHTMRQIQDSSRTINEIVGLIDSIAFQTNILALNAAVEAARAGEQGKGFAVVASEVRSLAQRSAAAAKDIKNLISQSVEQSEAGTRVVNQAGQTMQQIVESTVRVSELLADISRATSEQSAGISMVNGAITELDRMTQQNAALVEETLAAASSMADVANSMVAEVGRFKLPAHPATRPTY